MAIVFLDHLAPCFTGLAVAARNNDTGSTLSDSINQNVPTLFETENGANYSPPLVRTVKYKVDSLESIVFHEVIQEWSNFIGCCP